MDALPLALAHPGHGLIEAGALWHYLIEPAHGLVALAGLAFAGGLAVARLRRRGRR